MKHLSLPLFLALVLLAVSCTSQQKLAYLNNLPETTEDQYFTMSIPDYKIQPRDIIFITIKAMTPDGRINDFLSSVQGTATSAYAQSEAGQYLSGYDVNSDGEITVPVLGTLKVAGVTLDEVRKIIQEVSNKHFNNATVECKLLSFKFTVIGEVKLPGTYINYNNYLTVLEAIGRAGGVGDYGRRDKVLVIRPTDKGTKTYNLNLQDKNLLISEAYFLLPNDVVIVEPLGQKIFNLNLPSIALVITTVLSTITTTLLLIDYFNN
jgi:polysaccharide export outer membrane protein